MRTTHRNRQSQRLRGYDYAAEGAYFVTICTHERAHVFGAVVNDTMRLNAYGQIAAQEWNRTATLRENVTVPAFVVMPNHVHAIIIIENDISANVIRRGLMHQTPTPKPQFARPIAGSLGTIVATYKAAVTRQINRLPNPPDGLIWQRNYHDHIIRHQRAYDYIVWYIQTNPERWLSDQLYTRIDK